MFLALWREKNQEIVTLPEKPKGEPFTLIRFCRLLKSKKNQRGDPLETKEFEKNSHSAKKIKRWTLSPRPVL